MDDARPRDAGDAAVFRVAGEQRVDQRAARVTGGGMDDEAGRLVDDQHVGVLVDDGRAGSSSASSSRGLGSGHFQLDDGARKSGLVGLDRPAVERDAVPR